MSMRYLWGLTLTWVSLGTSLICLKYLGPWAAGVAGLPALLFMLVVFRDAAYGLAFVARRVARGARETLRSDDRARIGYVDVVLGFASLVAIAVVSQWIFQIIDMLRQQVDPLTSVLVGLLMPMLLIGLIYSVGVSARR
jgi:hypothetical protein